MRAAHIHIKVGANGHRLVTTELYVKGDSHNSSDFGVRSSLQMALAGNGRDGKLGAFDFVLRHA
jgi:catechol 1,2-dioxygenase